MAAATQVPPSKTPTPSEYLPPPPPADLSEPEDYKKTFAKHKSSKTISKFSDPCEKASKASLKCLEQTRYNRAECYDYFMAYRECKKKWLAQRKEDNMKATSH